jgi:hypothetical protein
MRLLFLIPALLLPAASAAAPAGDENPQRPAVAGALPIGNMRLINPSTEAGNCPPISRYHAVRRGVRPQAKTLGELPAADHYKTAYRRIGGCEVPIVVSYGVGGR